jgi:small-conductance mechanosensitive channel
MKNTLKKNSSSNNTTKKYNVKKCMETFVEKKIKFWTKDIDNQIQKLENKKMTKEENKMLTKLKKERRETITLYKKNYKLYNCNVNCKNTILEPGPPGMIPKSMQAQYNNDKQWIQLFNKQRKSIFKNKTNVLVDNFYEKTNAKLKKQLIKEGAISQCTPSETYIR